MFSGTAAGRSALTMLKSSCCDSSSVMASALGTTGSYTTTAGRSGLSWLIVDTMPMSPFDSCTSVPGG